MSFDSVKLFNVQLLDGTIYQIEERKLSMCQTLLPMMENNDDGENIMIPHDINKNTFDKIIEYMDYYQIDKMNVIPKPIPKDKILSSLVQPFYSNYIYGDNNDLTKDQSEELERLIEAANFLNNMPLLSICCAKMAMMIRSADKDKLNILLGINDYYTHAQ